MKKFEILPQTCIGANKIGLAKAEVDAVFGCPELEIRDKYENRQNSVCSFATRITHAAGIELPIRSLNRPLIQILKQTEALATCDGASLCKETPNSTTGAPPSRRRTS